ncbi:SUMF1/EgtB/PvdO family nonheme iron enzyme [Sphingomonas sp. BIUV-7]|uniref:SUMF1/EgtB/PvdO family nonheme iron enzyme n=1 Tax=Sphingomonas natans TaxID=3063330 RepID=A0ABT8YBJ0_9SPHN|nr:SUMF1/EgtB/PvdO family nonheme iron enzyme [Sphingomonas sp. BIUV-7]MDO6415198.1 SUMF1/EgtB/PvdO family nonheme iron enzyme [Sphingomonas sp. BIUV-7]
MRGRLAIALALLLAMVMALAAPAMAQRAAEPRLALVIANGQYRSFDGLSATYGDGDKIAAALTATGFVDASGSGGVRARRDLNTAAMLAEIEAFKAKLAAAGPNSFGMLYYSGHGVALGAGGDVTMVPVDATAANLAAGLSRLEIARKLIGSGTRTLLVVLDMCRSIADGVALPAAAPPSAAPAPAVQGAKGFRRVLREGEGQIRVDQGYLVAFSTSAGEAAFDDGIFSKVLAEEIRRPQQNIAEAMKRVSDRVALKPTGAYQKPTFDYGLQGQPPCFVSCDPTSGDRFYDCANCPWMRPIPAGTAQIGSLLSEVGRRGDEPAQHDVPIARAFALGVYEVTVAEWSACVREGACARIPSWAKENPNPLIPASSIGYGDAQAFVAWLSARSGRVYRLPSEEEWEYASRAGSGTAFAWGDEIAPSNANYDQTGRYRGSPTSPYRGYPEAVNAYPANSFGLYQTEGNVWEWTSGCVADCRRRIVRGGSFQSVPAELRLANRFAIEPSRRRDDVGLRVARDLDPDEVARP